MIDILKVILWFLFLLPLAISGQVYTPSSAGNGGLPHFWNPALTGQQQSGVRISIMEVQSSLFNSGFAWDDAIYRKGNKNVIDLQPVLEQLKDTNKAVMEAVLHTLGVQWKMGDGGTMGIGHRIHYTGDFNYSEEMARILTFGNGAIVGEETSIGPGFSYTHYHEIYLSGAIELGRTTLGARVKVLAGNEYMGTPETRIDLTTGSEFYSLQFSNDYVIESAGLFTYDGLDQVNFDFDPFRLQKFFGYNRGFAFDIGADIQIGRESNLMFALNDLGSIKWNSFTRKYESRGKFDYDGIDILDIVAEEGHVSLSDSLFNLLEFEETENEPFTTSLATQWSAAFKFRPGNANAFLIAVYGTKRLSGHRIRGFIGYTRKVSRKIAFSLSYLTDGISFDNLGATLFLTPGKLNLYFGLDNVFSVSNLLGNRYTGVHLGTSVEF